MAVQDHKLLHTPEKSPYIQLETKSKTPMYLTNLYPFDVQAEYELMSHPEVNSRLQNVPWPYTMSHAEEWVKIQTSKSEDGNAMRELPLSAIRAESPGFHGELVGTIGLRPHDTSEGAYMMGYSLHPDWQRLGIMTAAVKAAIWYEAVHRGILKSVVIQVADDNLASRRVVQSFGGFLPCPELDHVTEWPASKGGGKKQISTWKWSVS